MLCFFVFVCCQLLFKVIFHVMIHHFVYSAFCISSRKFPFFLRFFLYPDHLLFSIHQLTTIKAHFTCETEDDRKYTWTNLHFILFWFQETSLLNSFRSNQMHIIDGRTFRLIFEVLFFCSFIFVSLERSIFLRHVEFWIVLLF